LLDRRRYGFEVFNAAGTARGADRVGVVLLLAVLWAFEPLAAVRLVWISKKLKVETTRSRGASQSQGKSAVEHGWKVGALRG
jgi:hypothetical protein